MMRSALATFGPFVRAHSIVMSDIVHSSKLTAWFQAGQVMRLVHRRVDSILRFATMESQSPVVLAKAWCQGVRWAEAWLVLRLRSPDL